MNTCTKCLCDKPKSEFYSYKRNTIKGVSARCKECIKAAQRERNKTHVYTEADRARSRAWEIKNREKVRIQAQVKRARNIEGARLSVLKWERNNPEKKALHRYRLRNAIPKWHEADKIKILYQKAKKYGFEVDHIVPIVSKIVCGLHCWHNLQLLDRKMNAGKGNKWWPDMTQLPDATLQAITK